MAKPPVVGVKVDGQVGIHIPGTANYATLCGMDGDDPALKQEPAIVPRNAYINCPHCRAIWERAKMFKRTDFERR